MRPDCLDAEKGPAQVRGENVVPFLLLDLEESAYVGARRGVDECRQVTHGQGPIDGSGPCLGVPNVEQHRVGIPPELGREQRNRLRVEVAENERPPVGVESPRDGRADPTPRARDERDPHSSRLAPMAPPRSPSSASR